MGGRHVQNPQTKNADKADFLTLTDVERLDEGGRNAQNGNVQQKVRHTETQIHDGIIRRRRARHPIAAKRPYLEEGRKKERNQPSQCENQKGLYARGVSACGKESSVEAEYRKFDQAHGQNVPKLQHEHDLRFL